MAQTKEDKKKLYTSHVYVLIYGIKTTKREKSLSTVVQNLTEKNKFYDYYFQHSHENPVLLLVLPIQP